MNIDLLFFFVFSIFNKCKKIDGDILMISNENESSVKVFVTYLFAGHTDRCTFSDDAVLNYNTHHNRISWVEYELR